MYAQQFETLVALLKEIRDRLPQQVKVQAAPTEAPTRLAMWTVKPDVVPYTIKHPISRTETETRRGYVDGNAQIRFIDPLVYAPQGWRALWIERETK